MSMKAGFKKLLLSMNLTTIYYYPFQQDLLETGLRQDIQIKFYKLYDYIKKILLELNLKLMIKIQIKIQKIRILMKKYLT